MTNDQTGFLFLHCEIFSSLCANSKKNGRSCASLFFYIVSNTTFPPNSSDRTRGQTVFCLLWTAKPRRTNGKRPLVIPTQQPWNDFVLGELLLHQGEAVPFEIRNDNTSTGVGTRHDSKELEVIASLFFYLVFATTSLFLSLLTNNTNNKTAETTIATAAAALITRFDPLTVHEYGF